MKLNKIKNTIAFPHPRLHLLSFLLLGLMLLNCSNNPEQNAPNQIPGLNIVANSPTSITISWDKPTVGNDPINYTVQYKKTSEVSFQSATSVETSVTIGNLQTKTEYVFAIFSENDFGRSPLSATFKAIPDYPAEKIKNFKIIPNNKSVLLTWRLNPATNEGDILGYDVLYRKQSDPVFQTIVMKNLNTSFWVKSLDTPQSYVFKVVSKNFAGTASTNGFSTTVIGASPVRNLTVIPNATDFLISWEPPFTNAGVPIPDHYRIDIELVDGSGTVVRSFTNQFLHHSVTATGFNTDQNYKIIVWGLTQHVSTSPDAETYCLSDTYCINTIGDSIATIKAPIRLPGAVENFYVYSVDGFNSATLKWEAPKSNSGSPPDQYYVYSHHYNFQPSVPSDKNFSIQDVNFVGATIGDETQFSFTNIPTGDLSSPHIVNFKIYASNARNIRGTKTLPAQGFVPVEVARPVYLSPKAIIPEIKESRPGTTSISITLSNIVTRQINSENIYIYPTGYILSYKSLFGNETPTTLHYSTLNDTSIDPSTREQKFVISNLNKFTSYKFSIRASNLAGNSPPRNINIPTIGPVEKVTSFSLTPGLNKITLTLTNTLTQGQNQAPSAYKIRYKKTGDATYREMDASAENTSGTFYEIKTINSLTNDIEYSVSIKAIYRYSDSVTLESGYSPDQTATPRVANWNSRPLSANDYNEFNRIVVQNVLPLFLINENDKMILFNNLGVSDGRISYLNLNPLGQTISENFNKKQSQFPANITAYLKPKWIDDTIIVLSKGNGKNYVTSFKFNSSGTFSDIQIFTNGANGFPSTFSNARHIAVNNAKNKVVISGKTQITTFTRNATSGALTYKGQQTGLSSGGKVHFHPQGNYFYQLNGNKVHIYQFSDLTKKSSTSMEGSRIAKSLEISLDGRELFVFQSGSSSSSILKGYMLASDGASITSNNTRFSGGGAVATIWAAMHSANYEIIDIEINPDGTALAIGVDLLDASYNKDSCRLIILNRNIDLTTTLQSSFSCYKGIFSGYTTLTEEPHADFLHFTSKNYLYINNNLASFDRNPSLQLYYPE